MHPVLIILLLGSEKLPRDQLRVLVSVRLWYALDFG